MPLDGNNYKLPKGTFIPRFDRSKVWLVTGVKFLQPKGRSRFYKMYIQLYRMEGSDPKEYYVYPVSFVPSKKKDSECGSFMRAIGVSNYAAIQDIPKFEVAVNAMLVEDRPHLLFSYKEEKEKGSDGTEYVRRYYRFQKTEEDAGVPAEVTGFSEASTERINRIIGG